MFHRMRKEINWFRLSPRGYINAKLSARSLRIDEAKTIAALKKFYSRSDVEKMLIKGTAGKVVILSFLPLSYVYKMEGLLGKLLQKQGWEVVVLTTAGIERLTAAYHKSAHGFEVATIESFVSYKRITEIQASLDQIFSRSEVTLADIKSVTWEGIPVGLHALATFLSGNPEGRFVASAKALRQIKRILKRSMLYVEASKKFLRSVKPDLVLGMEKGFVGTCEIFYSALLEKIDYVQWVGCHEPNSIMLKRYSWSNRRMHPFSIGNAGWDDIQKLPWDEAYRESVSRKFDSGYKHGDWYRYKSLTTGQDLAEGNQIRKSLGLDPKKKTAIIYSHILSDANLFYGEDIFSAGYEQWLVETVRAARENNSVNWVLKLHPANRVRNQRLGYEGEYGEIAAIRDAFGEIPSFLKVVYPEDKISPLSYFQITDYGITVRGTIGIELPCFGVPVLTAGTGRYSGKGFTIDSDSVMQYLERLRTIHELEVLSESQVRLAILYAYFVFKVRPAKYDKILEDTYVSDHADARERDIVFKAPSFEQIAMDAQLNAIVNFLRANRDEDFYEMAPQLTPRSERLT